MAFKSSNSVTWGGRAKQAWRSSNMSSLMGGEVTEVDFSATRQTLANTRVESAYQQVSLPLELPRNSRFAVEKRHAHSLDRDVPAEASIADSCDEAVVVKKVENKQRNFFTYQDIMQNVAPATNTAFSDMQSHRNQSQRVLLGPNTPVSLSMANKHQGRVSAAQLPCDESATVCGVIATTRQSHSQKQSLTLARTYRQYDMFDTTTSVQSFAQDAANKNRVSKAERESQRAAALRSISHILNTRLEEKQGLRQADVISFCADSNDGEDAPSQAKQDVFSDAARLKTLLQQGRLLWRGDSLTSKAPGWSSGYPALDAILPTQGWPAKSIIEVLTPAWGIGELKLLLPRMREVTQQKQWVIWISPPYQPYAPALLQAGVDLNYVIVIDPKTSCKDAIWSMEKALQTPACAMILAWTNWLPNGVVRRLQLAAEKGGGMAFLFRERETKNSPAALRLQLQPHRQGVTVEVLKARGSYHYKSVVVPLAG